MVPVFQVKRRWLRRCIRSVRKQHYRHWELLLVDDGGGDPKTRRWLRKWCRRDPRIHARFLEENQGIAGATNAGIAMARGRFVGLLDHDDELTPDALAWIVVAHNRNPDAEWFYSDEDKISRWGRCHGAYFKPDFSPEMLLSTMFTCHFSVFGTPILRRMGGLRPGFDGAGDHDLALRISESAPSHSVVHIPRVLYHWRTLPGSTAYGGSEKPSAAETGRRAVAEALAQRGLAGDVASHPLAQGVYRLHLVPKQRPQVAVLITPGGTEKLRTACRESVRKRTQYENYQIIEVPEASETPPHLSRVQGDRQIRIDSQQTHSPALSLVNLAAKQTDAEFLVLLDGRVRVQSDAWLEQLLAVAEMDRDIVGVGTLLSYPNRRVYHAGMILGIGGCAGYAHRGVWKTDPGYFGRLQCLQEFSAVTTRFVLLRRRAFLEAGGFDADLRRRTCADVDLWRRLRSQAGRCLYQPLVEGVFHPDRVRGRGPHRGGAPAEDAECSCGWQNLDDPFYNPNLTRENEQFLGFREAQFAGTEQQRTAEELTG